MNVKNYNWRKLGLELLVVFLGVTAGFLLNTWRTGVQEEKLEQKYIVGFLQDVDTNIRELEDFINQDSAWLTRATPLLDMLREAPVVPDSAHSIMALIQTASKMNLHTGTYVDITNSGNLNLISDFNLKSLVVDYHMAVNDVGFIDDYFNEFFIGFTFPFIMTEYDFLRRQFNNPEVVHTGRFSNVFTGYYSMVQQRKKAYHDLLEKSYSLREELHKNQDL